MSTRKDFEGKTTHILNSLTQSVHLSRTVMPGVGSSQLETLARTGHWSTLQRSTIIRWSRWSDHWTPVMTPRISRYWWVKMAAPRSCPGYLPRYPRSAQFFCQDFLLTLVKLVNSSVKIFSLH